jgi:ribosomal-protein-alanine N-acetyltransferase
VTVHIRKAQPADLETLLHIEGQSFSAPNWNRDEFLKYDCMVAQYQEQIAGFLVSREVFAGDAAHPAQCEILNVAVAPEFRRMGIATALISKLLSRGAEIFLEVRESNEAAQRLYRKLGFLELSRRPNYYNNPVETAIVMNMK